MSDEHEGEPMGGRGHLEGLEPVASSAQLRREADSHFEHDQDRIRLALEAVAEDPQTDARAPGSRAVLEALAETIWEWIDDLDMEISGDLPEQPGDAKAFDLLDRLRQIPGVLPDTDTMGEDQ